MPVKIRLGLEIERENVPYHRVNHAVGMTTTVRRAVQANRHRRFVGTVPNCQCDHCDTIRANRLVARGEIPGHALDTLSMGMSSDYAEAIAEGATLVRVGRGLFGDRPPG